MSSLIGLFALITPLLESTLTVPEVGEHSLRVLTPRLLEMHLVNTQQLSTEEIPTSPTTWDFLNFDGRQEMAPTTSSFEVDVDGSAFPVVGIGFRRQPLYAPLNQYDLRIGNSIFLLLGESVSDGAKIRVRDRPEDDVDYLTGLSFATEVDANRISPAIHVSQVGFEPTYETGFPGLKQGFVSMYLGDLGVAGVDEATNEWVVDLLSDASVGAFSDITATLGIDVGNGFELIDATDGRVVFTGELAERSDERWVNYRSVLEADFSEVVDPGWYRLKVPGLGASLPFGIYEGVASTLARTLALGVYHQRSAQDHALPYTRFIDGPGHQAPAFVPFDDVAELDSYKLMIRESDSFFAREDIVHPAPQIRDAETMLYPYVGDVIAWWPMDETVGLRDLSAHDADGERFGGLALAESDGKVNQALHFDGVDDHAKVNAVPALAGASELTMTFWIRVETRDREQVIFSKGAGWECRYDPVTKGLKATFGGVDVSAPWRDIGDGGWHFVMLRFEAESSGGLHWFVDHLAAGEAVSTVGLASFPTGGDAPLYFGNLASLDNESFFHGMLDDVRWRKSVISGEEAVEASTGHGPWVDVSGGHFDAGDYSKYMKNSGLFVHVLAFMLDQGLEIGTNLPQAFDHLGIPESGDGVSDLVQEVKWEADYIAKMQDTDGGFFSMVNPRTRRFENDVVPSEGDRQVVWPKTLIASGVAVGALAQLGNSPAFRAVYPQVAQRYREQALHGWEFIERAVDEHGVLGGHQRIFHYGANFDANDEVAYAAAALFAMTGDPKYEARLIEWMPYDPNLIPDNNIVEGWRAFRRHTWQRLYESVGAAMRTYAFSNRGALSGQERVFDGTLIRQKRYVDHVLEEIIGAGDDQVARAQGTPFGASVPVESKRFGAVGYFFGGSEAFDLIAAELLDPKPEYGRTLLSNVSYQAGGNPVNVCFLSGLGWKQQRNLVSQWALNDERQLPPIGYTVGSVNSGLPYLDRYQALLGRLTYPPFAHERDFAIPFGTYDRYADTFHVGNEFVILDHGRSLATMTYLMAEANDHEGTWVTPPAVSIVGTPASIYVGQTATVDVYCEDDLAQAQVIWEASGSEPHRGSQFTLAPKESGEGWVELEVLWPDGRRSFARETLQVRRVVESAYIENYQPMTSDYGPAPYRKILGNPNVQDYYPLDGDGVEAHADGSSPNVVLLGGAEFAPSEFDYPGYKDFRPGYQTVRLQGAGDALEVVYDSETGTFPSDAQWISVEAMVFVEAYEPEDADADFLSLTTNRETRLRLSRNRWDENLYLRLDWGETTDLPISLPLREWLHLRLVKQPNSASVFVDGVEVLNVLDDGFADWLEPRNEVRFRIGDFFGRASDMIVKSGVGPLETIDPIKEIVPGAPVFEVQASPKLDLGDSFTPQVTLLSSSEGLRYEWSGPDSIQFEPDNRLAPKITFTETGEFELNLTVTNQEGISRVDRSFVSVRDFSGNQAPLVDAGPPEAVSIRALWQAQPSVSDDSLPENTLAYAWNQISGPATVTFSDRLAQSAEVTFPRRGVYVLELVVDDSHRQGRDQVSIAVEDEIRELVPGIPFMADAETLALYHFDGDFNDASGNDFHLTPEGAPTFSDNVAWMKEPSGQSVAFAALGQQLVANMPHTERGFTLEWRCYLTEFLAYSLDAVELVGYYQDFDARLAFYQHRWTQPRIAGFDLANDTAISSEVLEPYLPRNTWIDMAMRYDATGMAAIYINGVPIYDQATAMQTRADKSWTLTLGNFEGYVDELRVSRAPREIPLANRAPLVAMETGGVLEEPGTVAPVLPAIVDDDPALVYSWSVVSGNAANVTFSDGSALDTEITFAKNGLYTIELTVSDGELATTVSTVWTVGMDTPPMIQAETREATLSFGTPFVPQVTVVDDDWAGGTELMTSWEVVQGDPAKVTFTDASLLQPTATFAEAGDYTLTLKVSDGESVIDADFTITVLPKLLPPVIRNTEPQVSLRLDDRFTPALEVEGDGPIAYRWSVSSGAAAGVSISDATTLNPTIQFNQVGEYELTIEATARDDLATSTVQVVVLRNLLPPAIRNDQPMVSLRLDETFTSTLETAGDGPFIYEWSVSRGQAAQVVFSDLAVLNPTITFGEVGEYEVTIEAMARDEVATSTVQVVVLRNLLPPVIRNDHPTVSLQLDETFTSTLEVEGDGPFAYEWTVSRGQTDQVAFSELTLLNPTITFTEIGEYELTLLASARGDHSTSTVQVSVLPVPTPLERWRSANFRAETLNDPNLQGSVWGDLADPDGDGRVNLLEAYAGTDPFEPNLGPFLRVQQIEGQLILQWPRATDPLGLSARVLTSMTLENFKPVEPDPSITVGANGREVEVRLPVDQAKSFLMIRVSLDR